VWQQIPAVVLPIAADNWYVGWHENLPGMLKVVAGASRDVQQRQMELEQRVRVLEQQLAAQSVQTPWP
jgi:hypothetical protein